MSDSGKGNKRETDTEVESQDVESTDDEALLKRLLRKTDLLVMPGLCLAYFTNTLDRANLGNAKTDGIEQDLNMSPNQFSLLLTTFYIPYALFNIPWSILSKRFNPSVIIPLAVALWGGLTMATVASKKPADIFAFRFFMGAVEASYKPCEVYYLSTFYTRKEMGFRVSWIGQMGFIAGAVSGLISWAVFQWNKKLHGWQYLFLIEGGITIAVAIWLYICAPRSPEKCTWYTEEERQLAIARVQQDSQDQDKHFRWSDAIHQLKLWQTWAYAFMALMYGVGVASSSNFLPTMIKRLTKNTVKANLYTVGPNLTASVIQLTTTWLSDRYQQRASIACGTTVVSLIAWILLGTLDLVNRPQVGYFLTYLITFATFTPSNLVPVWLSSNVPTTTGRAVALGLNYMAMNLAGIISSVSYRDEDAPVYRPALVTAGVTQGAFIVACLAMRQYYVAYNRKLDRGDIAHAPGMQARPQYRAKGKPVNFGVVVFPAFQALDVFGPLDALNILSRSNKMNLYTIAPTLEPVSTKLVGNNVPQESDFGQRILPTHTFETAPPLDVLIVPGGQGTRAPSVTPAIEYIKATYPSLQYLITVCTGSGLAARAGVLDGKRATTNKLSWDSTVALRPEVNWIHHARWVEDGNIWTSSGISAGIDVTFAWIAAVHGEQVAEAVANRMEYTRVTDPNHDPFAELHGQKK
ncbi:hypothetical protein FDECE_2016 [Fusarium decemcellulare]|nr:hypothetical protein FDECE_2016 [Fusarium decemcellulare]